MRETVINKQERFLNLDLLRIFSMFLIVFLHSIDHSGVLEMANNAGQIFTFGYVFFVYFLSQICVNLFVLISGFFLSESNFKLEKLVRLWLETVFYSFLIKCFFMATGKIPFSPLSLISCFLPVFTGRYWFMTIYFGLYMLMPFLNILIKKLNVKQFTSLNILLFFLLSVWISFSNQIKGMNSGAGWGLSWFIVLYLAGAWFRKCYKKKETGSLKYFLIWITIAMFVLGCLLAGQKIPVLNSFTRNLYRYDSAPVYVSSLLVFTAFLNINIKNDRSKILRVISGATLGVYLIHAHANVSPWLWEDLTRIADYTLLKSFPFIHISFVLAIYSSCILLSICGNTIVSKICFHIKKYAVIPKKIFGFLLDSILYAVTGDEKDL